MKNQTMRIFESLNRIITLFNLFHFSDLCIVSKSNYNIIAVF